MWRLLQDVHPADASPGISRESSIALVSDGLDPVIEYDTPDVVFMAFGSLARFRISFADRTVRLIECNPSTDQNTIDHLADDHVAPRIIAAGGELVLHGSVSLVGSRIAVFLGQTGAGKSTLAASLHAAGHRLLGDDAVVISADGGTIYGESVYPSLRLFRESINQVFRESVDTAAMAFYSDKVHVLAPDLGDAGAGAYALGAIYTLATGEDGVSLDLYSPAEACMALVENSFALDAHDQASAAQRMAQAARVAATVPCYELAYPYDFGLLGEARAQIIASLAPPPESA